MIDGGGIVPAFMAERKVSYPSKNNTNGMYSARCEKHNFMRLGVV